MFSQLFSKYLHEAPFCYGLAGLRELLAAWVLLARSWSPQERPRSAQNRAKSRPRPLQDRFQTSPRPPQDQPKTLMDSLRPFGLPVEPFWLPFGFHLAAFLINLIAFWLPSCLLRPGFGLYLLFFGLALVLGSMLLICPPPYSYSLKKKNKGLLGYLLQLLHKTCKSGPH